jgi:glycosylphosphatidylinositol transamidase (GPIT) subunit GPI8
MDKIIQLAAVDAERAARVVARSFYRVLRKNGFTDDQIINVANNMLDCLLESLDGYKEKNATEKVDYVSNAPMAE